jgi:hypothetical protein
MLFRRSALLHGLVTDPKQTIARLPLILTTLPWVREALAVGDRGRDADCSAPPAQNRTVPN